MKTKIVIAGILLILLFARVPCETQRYYGCFNTSWSELHNTQIGAHRWNMIRVGGGCVCSEGEKAPCTWFFIEKWSVK
jgi:hypothetical protein